MASRSPTIPVLFPLLACCTVMPAQDQPKLTARSSVLQVVEPDQGERDLRTTPVVRAVQKAAEGGLSFGAPTAGEVTFAEAVKKAKTAGHARVIACNGDYDEKLALAAAADGIKIYGGFKCSAWSYETGQRAILKPKTRGIVLTVDTLAGGATFEDVGFVAMPGSDPGESSIAAFVKESGAITMKPRSSAHRWRSM